MSDLSEIGAAAEYIRKVSPQQPLVGVVLGSGLGAFAERIESAVSIPYADIPNFPKSSVAGHKGELALGTIKGVPCAVMCGRVHFYEGYPMSKVTFPVRVLAALGVKQLVITNAAGGLAPDHTPGDFMMITDHLNLTGTNPLIGENIEELGPRFPDMSHAYSERGQAAWGRAAKAAGVALKSGVYAGMSGPSYETPAEIRMLSVIGAHAVGMSTVAEVIVARHQSIDVAGLSVITNHAAGLSDTNLSHDEVKEVADRVRGPLCDLLEGVIGELSAD